MTFAPVRKFSRSACNPTHGVFKAQFGKIKPTGSGGFAWNTKQHLEKMVVPGLILWAGFASRWFGSVP